MELIALLVFVLVIFAAQNLLYRRHGLDHLEYNCYLSANEVYEGDEIELVEELSNKKWLPVPWLKSELTTSKWLDFAGAQSVVTDQTRFVPSFFMLKSYHRVVRKWKVKCLKFGVYRIEKTMLVASDLLGNVSLSMPVEISTSITVLPRPRLLEEMDFESRHLTGDLLVRRHYVADPFYISGVREYTETDPVSRINWLATAHEGQIMVHKNDYTASQSIAVFLNMQSREQEGRHVIEVENIENAIRVCASVFDSTLQTGIPVRFLTNASTVEDGESMITEEAWGAEHVGNLLRILANLKLVSTEAFPDFLRSMEDGVAATDWVVVTCYLDEEILAFARAKEMQGVRIKFLVPDTLNPSDIPVDLEVYCLCDYFNGEHPYEATIA